MSEATIHALPVLAIGGEPDAQAEALAADLRELRRMARYARARQSTAKTAKLRAMWCALGASAEGCVRTLETAAANPTGESA